MKLMAALATYIFCTGAEAQTDVDCAIPSEIANIILGFRYMIVMYCNRALQSATPR